MITVQMMIQEAKDPDNPHGWIYYLWRPPGSLVPVWKSSCNLMVEMPDEGDDLLTPDPVNRHFPDPLRNVH